MKTRGETPADATAIRDVHRAAFETAAEAELVDALRNRAAPIISFVADDSGSIVGHILFSPVMLAGDAEAKIMGLAPMAVLPPRQRTGIGSALVREGLDACRQLGADGVVVPGHATYYPRFAFQPASRFALRCEYNVADDVFMALELRPAAFAEKSGMIRYHSACGEVRV